MTGTLTHTATAHYVEHRYPLMDRPLSVGVRWLIVGSRRTGPFAPSLTDEGVELTYAERDTWKAYQQGDYLIVETQKMGEPLQEQEVPRPKVRKGIDLRYYLGKWEKYSKREGWVRA